VSVYCLLIDTQKLKKQAKKLVESLEDDTKAKKDGEMIKTGR
jgi:hypothetical protein